MKPTDEMTDQAPLPGEWRYSNGFVMCGTIRVFRLDCDTNPSPEFLNKLMAWVTVTLNAPRVSPEASGTAEIRLELNERQRSFNDGINAAKDAIRTEECGDGEEHDFCRATFINAIARKTNPYSYGGTAEIEAALAELREMFPDTWLSIEVSYKPVIGNYYFIRVYGLPKQPEPSATLSEAMQKVREFARKESEK